MFHVQCKQCGKWTTTADGSNLDAALSCNCCPENHDHAANANSCPGANLNHPDASCPHPDGGIACNVVTQVGDDCPGGHCGVGIAGCTVCRPVIITLLPGTAQMTMG